MSKLIISAPARIHINLISMNSSGYRNNGGIGFAINDHDTVFELTIDCENKLTDMRRFRLDEADLDKLKLHLDTLCRDFKLKNKISASILSGPRPHSGLGVGTSTKLALTEAIFILNNCDFKKEIIIKASRRGGTSGIGVNTYFNGGFVADIGILNNNNKLNSSSSKEDSEFPTPQKLVECPMPLWPIGIVSTQTNFSISGTKESSFFARNTPIPQADVNAACYHAIMGVTAAVLEQDKDTFLESIGFTQTLKWKKAEWAEQPPEVLIARDKLESNGLQPIGLSSFGPTLYFVAPSLDATYSKKPLKTYNIIVTTPNNVGRVIKYV